MKDVFGDNSERYDAWYEKNKLAYQSELVAIKKFLPKKGKGLEIGVGTGRFASALGIEWGIDPSARVLKVARERGIRVRKCSGEKLIFKKETFDYALSVVTLSFVKDPRKVIREAARVLRGKGKLVIGIVNRESFLGKYYLKKKGIFYKSANLWTPKEIRGFLTEAGFGKFTFCQTIFRLPSQMRTVHKVTTGSSRGGFSVIGAIKK